MGSKTARWSPDASDAESVSNNRVCLALLRIYRSVSLSDREVDGYGVAAPFWPVLREQHLLLRKGMDLSNKERPGRRQLQTCRACRQRIASSLFGSMRNAATPSSADERRFGDRAQRRCASP